MSVKAAALMSRPPASCQVKPPLAAAVPVGRRWAAAAYKRQGRNRDLVLVCVTPKPPAAGMLPKVGIVEEIKRTPACQSKRNGRYGFTDGGDVFFAHGGGFVTVGGRAFVLVDRGKKVITAGGWRPGADDPDPASFRLKSGAQVEILPDWVRQTRRDIFKGSWQEVADSLLADWKIAWQSSTITIFPLTALAGRSPRWKLWNERHYSQWNPILLQSYGKLVEYHRLTGRKRSGRRESSPHGQLGRLVTYPGRPFQFAAMTRTYNISAPLCCTFG